MTFIDLIKNFFTHKDFLPDAAQIPGTLFTPLHLGVSALALAIFVFIAYILIKTDRKKMQITLTALWATVVVLEVIKLIWETYAGARVYLFVQGALPLYPCSLFLFVFPISIWSHGLVKNAVCSYVCTLGFIGAAINFFYPANIMGQYSVISFSGILTLFTHGVMLTAALVLFFRREIQLTRIDSLAKLLTPALPVLIFSIPVNIVNFTCDADYMFFKCESFVLAPIGAATPDFVTVIIMYILYTLIHILPFLPSYIANIKNKQKSY